MVTLITRPMPKPLFIAATGKERAAKRFAHALANTTLQPTKESRQNRRAFERKARKMAASKVSV